MKNVIIRDKETRIKEIDAIGKDHYEVISIIWQKYEGTKIDVSELYLLTKLDKHFLRKLKNRVLYGKQSKNKD